MNLVDLGAAPVDHCTDALTFSFAAPKAASPGYRIAFARPPFVSAASGRAVPVAGNSFLVVHFEPAATFDLVTGTPTFRGLHTQYPSGLSVVRQISLLDDGEGVVEWVIGLARAARYRVVATAKPPTVMLRISS
jgi:hypothetical protein